MSDWGDTVPVEVTIPAYLSYTGKARQDVKQVDRAIAPYIVELNKLPGVRTIQSCCGHPKYEGVGGMSSGHLWVVLPNPVRFECRGMSLLLRHQRVLPDRCPIERVARLYIPEDCFEFVFLGAAHGKLKESMEWIMYAIEVSL